jgi:hypothetical protein
VQLCSAIALNVWRLDAEKVGPGAALRQFIGGRGPHIFNLHVQANRNPSERVVSVEHHVLRINIGHGEQRVARRGGVTAFG